MSRPSGRCSRDSGPASRTYVVFGDELRGRGYHEHSVFNWRTPLLLLALAAVPDSISRSVLVFAGVMLFAATIRVTARESLWILGSQVMLVGTVLPTVWYGALVMGEVWAGIIIGLSVCMYAWQRPRVAIVCGLMALFLRELAAPYCVACAVAAAAQRRWREVVAWSGGACCYAAYFAWHAIQVRAYQPANRPRTDIIVAACRRPDVSDRKGRVARMAVQGRWLG